MQTPDNRRNRLRAEAVRCSNRRHAGVFFCAIRRALSVIIASSLILLPAIAGPGLTQKQIDERILTWWEPFRVHRVAKAIYDESWLKIPETWKPARKEPADSRRYVWVSARSGIAFYVTVAFALDANEAKMLFKCYCHRIAMMSPGSPEYGADEIMRFGDRHLVARWGSTVVAIISRSEYAPAEIPKLMQWLQKILTEK